MKRNEYKKRRIGILGGMGPLAGVELQRRIIAMTPAEKDQDHVEVVCFTNPHIADRTSSLKKDGGSAYLADVRASLRILEDAGATEIIIACNTAHARLPEMQAGLAVPIVNMVDLAVQAVVRSFGPRARVGLLATDGTLDAKVYEKSGDNALQWLLPDALEQQAVMDLIYRIKSGRMDKAPETLRDMANSLVYQGAEVILVACTELSLCTSLLQQERIAFIDSLQVAAQHVADPPRRLARAAPRLIRRNIPSRLSINHITTT